MQLTVDLLVYLLTTAGFILITHVMWSTIIAFVLWRNLEECLLEFSVFKRLAYLVIFVMNTYFLIDYLMITKG